MGKYVQESRANMYKGAWHCNSDLTRTNDGGSVSQQPSPVSPCPLLLLLLLSPALSSKHILGVTKKQPTAGASNRVPVLRAFLLFAASLQSLGHGQGHFYVFYQISMSRNLGNKAYLVFKRYVQHADSLWILYCSNTLNYNGTN